MRLSVSPIADGLETLAETLARENAPKTTLSRLSTNTDRKLDAGDIAYYYRKTVIERVRTFVYGENYANFAPFDVYRKDRTP